MLNQGNNNDAKAFRVSNTPNGYGIRKKGNFFEIKLRLKDEIANYIDLRLTADNLFITNTSNKGCKTIYGHCTQYEMDLLDRMKRSAMGQRLIQQGLAMMPK